MDYIKTIEPESVSYFSFPGLKSIYKERMALSYMPWSSDMTHEQQYSLICNIVCDYHKVSLDLLFEKGRHAGVVRARHTAIFLCRSLIEESYLHKIATYFNRDHSTILHAINKIKDDVSIYKSLELNIINIISILEQKTKMDFNEKDIFN